MMWFATANGLNKYDGYKFTVYKNIPGDSTSLSNNWITTIYEDRTGQIWVGTNNGGLCRFNRETDNFKRYIQQIDDSTKLRTNLVTSIFETSPSCEQRRFLKANHVARASSDR